MRSKVNKPKSRAVCFRLNTALGMLLCGMLVSCDDDPDKETPDKSIRDSSFIDLVGILPDGPTDQGPPPGDYLASPDHLWFKLNSEGGEQMVDSSSNQAHAQLSGSYTWSDGKIVFSSPDSGGQTPDMPLDYREVPHSISAWVMPYERSDRSINDFAQTPFPVNCVSNDIPSYGGFGFGINVWTDGDPGSMLILGVVGNVEGVSFNANQRYHVVVVYSETETVAYVDNEVVYSGGPVSLSAGSAPVYVGRHNNDSKYGTKRFFVGEMDDVRVYQQALTPADVAALFADGPV